MELKGSLCEFLSSDNYRLVGMLNNVKSDVAVIHLHGMGSFFWKGDYVYDACKRAGVGCFLINTRGAGPVLKLKTCDDEKLWAGTAYEVFEDSVYDIEGALEFLREKGYEKFILCGHSTGAQKVLNFGLEKMRDDVVGFVFLGAGDDLNLLRDRYIENFDEVFAKARESYDSNVLFAISEIGYFSSKRFYDLVKEDSVEGNLFNYKSDLSHIQKIDKPILSVFGRDEQHAIIPVEEMIEKISNNYVNDKSDKRIVAGDHSFCGGEDEVAGVLAEWIEKIV